MTKENFQSLNVVMRCLKAIQPIRLIKVVYEGILTDLFKKLLTEGMGRKKHTVWFNDRYFIGKRIMVKKWNRKCRRTTK